MNFTLPKNQEELRQYSQELRQYSAGLYKKLLIMQRSRIFFHTGGLLVIFLVMLFVPQQAPYVLTTTLLLMIIVELTRLLNEKFNHFFVNIIGSMLRDYEKNHITAVVLTLTGLTIVSWLFPPFIAQAAVLTLAFCDPASSVIGSLLKGRKIFIDYEHKSWSGAIACFLTAFLVLTIFSSLANHLDLIPWAILLASGAATLGEINNRPMTLWNDNWMIPVFTAIMLWSTTNLLDYLNTAQALIKIIIK